MGDGILLVISFVAGSFETVVYCLFALNALRDGSTSWYSYITGTFISVVARGWQSHLTQTDTVDGSEISQIMVHIYHINIVNAGFLNHLSSRSRKVCSASNACKSWSQHPSSLYFDAIFVGRQMDTTWYNLMVDRFRTRYWFKKNMCSSLLGGNDDEYFSKGLKPPNRKTYSMSKEGLIYQVCDGWYFVFGRWVRPFAGFGVCVFCFETQFLIGKGFPLSLENRTDHQNCRHKINGLNVTSA